MGISSRAAVVACLLVPLTCAACHSTEPAGPPDPLVARLECADAANDVAFSPDGRLLAAACGGWRGQGVVKVWDFTERRLIATLAETMEPRNYVQRIAFSPDGKLLALGTRKGEVTIWDVETQERLTTVRREGGSPKTLTFSPNGKLLMVAYDHSVYLFDLTEKSSSLLATHNTKEDYFGSAAFSPDGRSLVTAERNVIRIWDPAAGKVANQLPSKGSKFFLLFSPDGRFVISGGGAILGLKSVKVWDVAAERQVTELSQFRAGIFSAAVSPARTLFALGGGNYGTGGDLSLWSLPGGEEKAYVSFGRFPIQGLAFSSNGSHLAAASADGVVLIYAIDRMGGPQIREQGYFLCGEIQRRENEAYLVPLSKVPPPMAPDFHYNWELPLINADELAHLDGVPIALLDWKIHSYAGGDRIAVHNFRELGPTSKNSAALEDYVVFADIADPGWNRGKIVKIYSDGSFVATNNPGVCMAYGSLSQSQVDQTFAGIRSELLENGFLALPEEPQTRHLDHYRTRFIELSMGGTPHLRTDAEVFSYGKPPPEHKYEKFHALYRRFEGTISALLRSGRRKLKH